MLLDHAFSHFSPIFSVVLACVPNKCGCCSNSQPRSGTERHHIKHFEGKGPPLTCHGTVPNRVACLSLQQETNAALAQIQPGAFSVATAVALFGALSLV